MRNEKRLVALALGAFVNGCGSPTPAPTAAVDALPKRELATRVASSAPVSPRSTEKVEPPTTAPALMSPETRGSAPACAFTSLGFDRRALPTSTSPEGFDNWVLGEADSLRHAAPKGTSPRILKEPGSSTLHALFDGDSDDAVMARCVETVKVYLPKAPNLPLIGSGSAVHVQTACRLCQ